MNKNDIIFADEKNNKIEIKESWSILVIDDDLEVHTVTKLALHDFIFDNKKLNIVSAYSEKQAKEILEKRNDFAFVLLDIVMENNDSGLKIVQYIREKLQNKLIRIIIRTGETGYAPEAEIINNYDINDYKEKTELTVLKLYTTTRTALSQYKQLKLLEDTKNELYNTLIIDSVTNLYTRKKLYTDLKKSELSSLIQINIDSFSTLNNTYGYLVGDNILRKIALILESSVLDSIGIYRIEADKFVLLFENKTNKNLENIANNIKSLISGNSINVNELTLFINVSIGIVNYPETNLLQKSEIALHASRKKQDNKIEFYSEELNTIKTINNNLLWTKRLAYAIENNKLLAYYQPIIECSSKRIVKYEALVRLEHEGKVYSPFNFLEAARKAGLLTKITLIVFELSCKTFENNDYDFAVNITDHDLMSSSFTNNILNLCLKYNIKTSRVSLEILEEENVSKNIQAQNNLKKLKELGFELSIDDFGVEYSNFSQLKSLDISTVKIDGSFIKDIDTNINSKYIVEAILSYTKNIKVKTVAEFVHSKEVFETISDLGIDYAQGYYFGEPKSTLVK
ncbi:MAG: EAL domain-containing protein [Campylobacterales bacterium]|nr:EAL domain-containing protein [Campylobacterales bacterium]